MVHQSTVPFLCAVYQPLLRFIELKQEFFRLMFLNDTQIRLHLIGCSSLQHGSELHTHMVKISACASVAAMKHFQEQLGVVHHFGERRNILIEINEWYSTPQNTGIRPDQPIGEKTYLLIQGVQYDTSTELHVDPSKPYLQVRAVKARFKDSIGQRPNV